MVLEAVIAFAIAPIRSKKFSYFIEHRISSFQASLKLVNLKNQLSVSLLPVSIAPRRQGAHAILPAVLNVTVRNRNPRQLSGTWSRLAGVLNVPASKASLPFIPPMTFKPMAVMSDIYGPDHTALAPAHSRTVASPAQRRGRSSCLSASSARSCIFRLEMLARSASLMLRSGKML